MTQTSTPAARTAPACCRDAGLRHCHSTWIVHDDGTEECTAPMCETPAEGHALVSVCRHLSWACWCR